ncbi:MAG: hypothetical protein VXW31_02145 [Planctomycetota bacterium]|nr:hypothetical protein [Planctomycetota bacterium]
MDREPRCLHARPRSDPAAWSLPAGWQTHVATRERDALARAFAEADPLGLRALCGERAVARSFLLDLDDLQRRLVVRLARALAADGSPSPSIPMPGSTHAVEVWLRALTDEIVDEAVGRREERSDPAARDVFALLGAPLGLDASLLREGCARFNRAAESDRRAYLALLRGGCTLESAAAREGVSALIFAARARRALEGLAGAGAGAARG